ncbi:Mg2+ and Co2+ transporter CorB, contains DUF21, CBS pair, and CorC-HlyC domains [Allopseudospirillum japonicum]|uniref:Mg2+ and Co2+ transporter CorB, contains DUF21, CBS pair, and CorC-HlyC domains n=1 Tax=Allopseudospirillum japonicum TaxID=64971 RepID=A0A1H6QRM0_9GAMM|nr:HlyC/CorC family transporter [Allopseudospirillum japonicum]SEI46458.1 Mg2+ and Co2+ transporter CorB, contains DUF21, CBS pair, and CorC-HlyC domains [Allopseudospirillum japonicum]
MNDETSLSLLFGLLVLLILMSGFFSSSETGMMSLNRYRLSHKAKNKDKAALRVSRLLSRPDRLIGVILIGNNFVNILASSIATVVAMRLYGDAGIAIATAVLTLVILIFAEVMPKTLAAVRPERIAYPASLILEPLLKLLYPLVWLVNGISNGLLRLLGVQSVQSDSHKLTREELRTVVHEAGSMIPRRHQAMLLSILDLEKVTVNDIMIPRHEVVGIDLEHDMPTILEQLRASEHTRIPVFKGDINNVVGILHLRKAARVLSDPNPTKAMLVKETREPYFVPESTPLHTQLLNFQKEKRRIGIVVDEYGDVLGVVTLEDILEEIVGDFTTDVANQQPDIQLQEDGAYIIEGAAAIREINKLLEWELPTDGPKTINGLVLEKLEHLPEANMCLQIGHYRFEVLELQGKMIRKLRALRIKRKRLLKKS